MILAIDPGLHTGWCTGSHGECLASGLYECGTRDAEHPGWRLVRFAQWLVGTIGDDHPTALYYESAGFVSKNMAATSFRYQLVAVMAMETARAGIPLIPVSWLCVKHTATGSTRADKDVMLRAAQAKWPESGIADHNEADARWIAEAAMKGFTEWPRKAKRKPNPRVRVRVKARRRRATGRSMSAVPSGRTGQGKRT